VSDSECRNAVVLLSGGIDSSACVHYYLSAGYNVVGLFIDYGHPASGCEKLASAKIAEAFGIYLHTLKITGAFVSAGEVRGRNALLVCSALMYMNMECGLVVLGIHAGTDYSDCSPSFISKVQEVADLYADGRIQIAAPFLQFSKADILDYAKKHDLPLALTYSCESGNLPPCGRCLSCRDLEELDARN
jgi:7-cyano-7-deazaguanine synthase